MNYHYRYDHEDNCEIICTRCFMTIGQARGLASVRHLEAQHQCPSVIEKKQGSPPADFPSHESLSTTPSLQIEHLFQFQMNAKRVNLPLRLLSVGFFLYVLPTSIELLAILHLSPWIVSILFGDLTGCTYMATVLKMPRTGVLLYLTLTVCEGLLYMSHLLPSTLLIWIVDLVPAIVTASRIAYIQLAQNRRNVAVS